MRDGVDEALRDRRGRKAGRSGRRLPVCAELGYGCKLDRALMLDGASMPMGNVRGQPMTIRTARLLLRPWRDADLLPFAELNADARVMEYLPKVLSRAESDATAARIRAHVAAHGFGLLAVEAPGEAPFLGFVGLQLATFPAPFTPCVEVGWRLAHAFWGRGYATEAARACLDHGFRELGLREILSFTTVANGRSRRVMEKLGMTHDPVDDFEHPLLPAEHSLRPHVLYRLERDR